jgi:hypothetical protein
LSKLSCSCSLSFASHARTASFLQPDQRDSTCRSPSPELSRFGARQGPPPFWFLNFRNLLDDGVEAGVDRIIPPRQRGVSRSSRTLGGMRWTRPCQKTNDAEPAFGSRLRRTGTKPVECFFERRCADGEGVWSWRPDAGAKFLRSKLLRDDGGKRARSPGRARHKPLKPLRREGRMIRHHLWFTPRAYFVARGPRVRAEHPVFPAPSVFKEGQG